MKVQVSSILDEKGNVKAWKVKKMYPWGIIEAICDNPGRLNDGVFDYKPIAERFRHASSQLDPQLADFVYKMLMQYPGKEAKEPSED